MSIASEPVLLKIIVKLVIFKKLIWLKCYHTIIGSGIIIKKITETIFDMILI